MKNLKEILVQEYKNSGIPPSVEDFSNQYRKELAELGVTLRDLPLLDNMFALTPAQAYQLLDFYGKGFLFSEKIENGIYNYQDLRKKNRLV